MKPRVKDTIKVKNELHYSGTCWRMLLHCRSILWLRYYHIAKANVLFTTNWEIRKGLLNALCCDKNSIVMVMNFQIIWQINGNINSATLHRFICLIMPKTSKPYTYLFECCRQPSCIKAPVEHFTVPLSTSMGHTFLVGNGLPAYCHACCRYCVQQAHCWCLHCHV